MENVEPINQIKLFGLDRYFKELFILDNNDKLPNKIMLTGPKGQGKSTLAYHFINYILSKDEEFKYDISNFEINIANPTFKTTLNKSNPNLISIDINDEKKFIDINQIRELIYNLKKTSFNKKPKFVLIDNIELLNINSVNALLKILEEPSNNIFFILINNNKKVLSTLLSRCINFKIFLSNKDSLTIADKLLDGNLSNTINMNLINYYLSPGNIYSEDGRWPKKFIKNKNLKKSILKNVPLKRFGTPSEIANAVIFLSSSYSSFTTGSNLVIDGGESL